MLVSDLERLAAVVRMGLEKNAQHASYIPKHSKHAFTMHLTSPKKTKGNTQPNPNTPQSPNIPSAYPPSHSPIHLATHQPIDLAAERKGDHREMGQ